LSVHAALATFAQAYCQSTGARLVASEMQLSDGHGKQFDGNALLPCGLRNGADFFISSSALPTLVDTSAEASPSASVSRPVPPVTAKEGSAIAASQAKMGEHSYYYSVGKAGDPSRPPVQMPERKAVTKLEVAPTEATISTFSFMDDDDVVKVHIPLPGASSLPVGSISCDFRERSFDLRVKMDTRLLRLHVPITHEEIEPSKCSLKPRQGKLIVVLVKRDSSKQWYELRKTKGVGDTEYSKLVPDAGEASTVTI